MNALLGQAFRVTRCWCRERASLVSAEAVFPAQPVQYLNSGKVLPTNLPFSEAGRAGDLLYLSGQIGIVPGTLVQVVSATVNRPMLEHQQTNPSHGGSRMQRSISVQFLDSSTIGNDELRWPDRVQCSFMRGLLERVNQLATVSDRVRIRPCVAS